MTKDTLYGRLRAATYLTGWRQREVLLVLGLALATIVTWRVPLIGWLLYPFRVYGIFIHEISHGLAAIFTGGAFRRFVINPDLSGTAFSAGGIRWIVVSAGYVGSAIFGGMLTVLSASAVPARRVLIGLGLALGVLALVFVRNLFGLGAGVVLAALLIVAGLRLRETWADGVLLLLAVQMMLSALDSVFDLVQISADGGEIRTDAQTMALATGIPALVWAALWSVLALAILVVSLRLAYRRTPPSVLRDQLGSG